MAENSKMQHWPVMLLIGLFTVVFIISMMLFQVKTTDVAIVKRFGEPTRMADAGLHFKWPWPVEEVWHEDNRVHVFEGTTGKLQELITSDGINVVMTIYVGWKIDESSLESTQKYMSSVTYKSRAEELITGLMQNHKRGVIGTHSFSELVNIDTKKVKLTEIEAEILNELQSAAKDMYGIDIRFAGIKYIGLPESVSQKVFERMKAERERISKRITSEGEAQAAQIRAEANRERARILDQANQTAKALRAEGDAEAAKSYEQFKAYPELAMFLRQLEALRNTLSNDTTLVFDNNTPPFNMFSSGVYEALKRGDLSTATQDPGVNK